jgi:hypothetical protein
VPQGQTTEVEAEAEAEMMWVGALVLATICSISLMMGVPGHDPCLGYLRRYM